MKTKPPIGVTPWKFWVEICPDPTLLELLARYVAVSGAAQRYRDAGLEPNPEWLRELGVFGCHFRGREGP